MSEFTELLDAYTKLKADYDEIKAWGDRTNERLKEMKYAAQNRMDLIIEGVTYMPEERAQIVYLPDGMRIGARVAHIVPTDVCDER